MIIKDNSNGDIQLSKRQLLKSIGMVGGSAAVYGALQGWNLAHASSKTPPKISTEGNGKKIVILGAGLAGMIIALEMSKKGYDCQILEAQSYIGGRCQSARKGHVIHEVEGEKQVCNFTHDQYFNYGPWRIPAQHHPTLHYCHTLGVKLEPLINKSPMGYYMSEKIDGPLKNKPLRQGEVDVDRMGNFAELLAKCADQGMLDEMVTEEDKEAILEYFRGTGLIDRKDLSYGATRIRGYSEYPGAGTQYGELSDPLDFSELMRFKVATRLEFEDHPIVMFQPVGGMDRIAHAIHDALPNGTVTLNAEVTNIMQSDDGVSISYKDLTSGNTETVNGDFCVSTIPFPVVSKIPNNFSKEVDMAIKAPAGMPAFKQGLQFDRRFWEQDDMIYGGNSITDVPGHSVTAYPSSDLHSNLPGVVLGSYIWGGEAARLSNLSIKDRVEFALDIGERLHPGNYRKHFTGNAMTIGWHRHKYQLGGWVMWTNRKRRRQLPTVLKGENRVLFSGNGISTIHTGWMVGAIEGAWHTIADLDKRAAQI